MPSFMPFRNVSHVARRARRAAARGFTLIELLLVLVILTALAAMVVPRFPERLKQAKITAARSDIASIELALDVFETDCGRYPTNEEGLRALLEPPGNVTDWHGPYLKKGLPKDRWGNPYVYRYPGPHTPTAYDLHSFGPDGQDGGDDDITSWSEEK